MGSRPSRAWCEGDIDASWSAGLANLDVGDSLWTFRPILLTSDFAMKLKIFSKRLFRSDPPGLIFLMELR